MTPAGALEGARWKNASNQNGSCVDLALPGQGLAVRDSKNAAGPVLVFSEDAGAAWLEAVKSGKFDA